MSDTTSPIPPLIKVFFSYHFGQDTSFVLRVRYYLAKRGDISVFCYSECPKADNWVTTVGSEVSNSDFFVLFVGPTLGPFQVKEACTAISERERLGRKELKILRVMLGNSDLPEGLSLFRTEASVRYRDCDEVTAQNCARDIMVNRLGREWVRDDGLPDGYLFHYEKDITAEFSKKTGPTWELRAKGCPDSWPRIEKQQGEIENPVPTSEIGLYRDLEKDQVTRRKDEPQILAAPTSNLDPKYQIEAGLTFVEAGPRKFLKYPSGKRGRGRLKVGILVSGGIAPGINAVIAGLVDRHFLYAKKGQAEPLLSVVGYLDGFSALTRPGSHTVPLTPKEVVGMSNQGGSLLGTSRDSVFTHRDPHKRADALRDAVHRLRDEGVDILYVIGGDGSMRAAHALWNTAHAEGINLSVVGVPKTMDNDILWVWQSFGFLSAVGRSEEIIQQLHTEAKSNPRLCVIQLFGSDSGFVVTHAVTASGVCDLFLVPEVPFTMKDVSRYITERLSDRFIEARGMERAYGMIVMAETAIPLDANDYLDDPDVALSEKEKKAIREWLDSKDHRVVGQTPDELRSGGLKLVSRVLQKSIQDMGTTNDYWNDFRVFTNEPRHLIRAIRPSSSDIIFAQRLGALAVDCAMAGYSDFMISQWLTEYVMVPLPLATLGRKRIPKEGIFYKSARASTGQPAELASSSP